MRAIGVSGFVKRALPFFATFAIALFITSFFVDLHRPRFGFRARGWERHQRMERLAAENEQLRMENEDLKMQLRSNWTGSMHHPGDEDAPFVPFDAPMPPPLPAVPVAPHAHR
jgi:hypothetical protein